MKFGGKLSSKKLIVTLLSVVFALITIACFFVITTVAKIDVQFAITENVDTVAVKNILDKNIGRNILSVKESEIEDSLNTFSYVDVIKIEKQFPNVLKVSVKERREVYGVEEGDYVHVLNEEGILLKTVSKSEFEWKREIIKLNLGIVKITDKTFGQALSTDSEQLFSVTLDMAKSVNLADCIKEISIQKYDAPNELSDVEFLTYTGVKICVYKAEEYGTDKAKLGFDVYDKEVSDYEKASDTLYVGYNAEKGKLEVTWSDRSVKD